MVCHPLRERYRARTGHGKPGKSWNLGVGHGKSWKMTLAGKRNNFGSFFLQNITQSNGNQDNFGEYFYENGQILVMENFEKSWKRSWNFKSPTKSI